MSAILTARHLLREMRCLYLSPPFLGMGASVASFSPTAIADMAATLSQSAAMVTHIAVRKTSIVISDRVIQRGGGLAHLREENERMMALVKSLQYLRVSLQKEK